MPTLWMMIGVPGSGKSTWIANQNIDWNNTIVVSTDAFIDKKAADAGKTYSDVFKDHIKAATSKMNSDIEYAIKNNMNIIWDQTNTSVKIRKAKLGQIPDTYSKVAVFFRTPDSNELKKRLDSRVGKNIPNNILMGMISQLEPPTKNEGFDEIINV